MRKTSLLLLALVCALAFGARTGLDPQTYLVHVKYLASPELRGRGTGTPELVKAAQYIARQFKAVGLHPPDGRSYFQEFQVTTNAELGNDNRIRAYQDGNPEPLMFKGDFLPFNFSW
jgi:hypothetical protein